MSNQPQQQQQQQPSRQRIENPSSSVPSIPKPPPLSLEQSKTIAQTHYDALKSWLQREQGLISNASRSSAREKLTRLTRQQFAELSTDVYDELIRRQDLSSNRSSDQPYLSVRNDFHPKRNQARQKLATLPLQRFRDLASDVYYELERRYPEFGEDEVSRSSSPHPPLNEARAALPSSRSRDNVSQSNGNNNLQPSNSNNNLVAASGRRSPSPLPSSSSNRDLNNLNGGAVTTTNDVVVPNKSTLVLEDAPNSTGGENNNVNRNNDSRSVGRTTSESSFGGSRVVQQYAGSATGNTEGRSWDVEELERVTSDYEYKITVLTKRTTELERKNEQLESSIKSTVADTNRTRELERQLNDHHDRFDNQTSTLSSLQSKYEFLRTEHSRSLASATSTARLQEDLDLVIKERNDIEDLANDLRGECSSLVDELRSVNERYEELLQASEQEIEERRKLEDEIKSWRKKYEGAKTELRNVRATSVLFMGAAIKVDVDHMPAVADGVIADVNVSSFQTSIDALLQAARSKEPSSVLPAMRVVVGVVDLIDRDLQSLAESRRILPSADQDRLVALKSKTHATLSNLMTASKNHAMSFGVSPVSLLDAAASHLASTVVDLIRLLKVRRTNPNESGRESRTLLSPKLSSFSFNNNSTSSNNHSASSSKSPPISTDYRLNSSSSSHQNYQTQSPREREYSSPPSTTIASNSERYDSSYNRSSPTMNDASRSMSDDKYNDIASSPRRPPLPSVAAARIASHASNRSREDDDRAEGVGGYEASPNMQTYGSPRLNDSQSTAFSQNLSQRDEDENDQDGGPDNWDEVKTYLETQTEAIVHSIQSLLSAIRGGAQSDQLNENLTQIITIVSSIVAISKDALLPATREEGDQILADLTDNCNRLSEMQELVSGGQVFNKATKQAMASASFGVAKSLKGLNLLLQR